jgi:hypothetical protein
MAGQGEKSLNNDEATPTTNNFESFKESPFDWSQYNNQLTTILIKNGYDLLPLSEDSTIIRAHKEWGQISAWLYIEVEGRLRFTMTRPLDQSWAQPVQVGSYTFELSRVKSEALTVSRQLSEMDCENFWGLLDELENIGHANWKNLSIPVPD